MGVFIPRSQELRPTQDTPLIYLVGSLRNPQVPVVAEQLRRQGFEVYDDWYAVGPEADDRWREYEQERGHRYREALKGWHAHHVFANDKFHLDKADGCVMVLPAGKSAHMEFGYMVGQGKWGVILLEGEKPRWDIMYLFAASVCDSLTHLLEVTESYLPVPF